MPLGRTRARDRSRGHALGGWSPRSLSGLVLYLNADVGITLNGSNVSAWADPVAGISASQGTAGAQPPYLASGGINGKASLAPDGVRSLQTPSISLGAYTIFLTARQSGTAGFFFSHGSAGADESYLYGSTTNTVSDQRAAVVSAWNSTSNWATDNAVRCMVITYDGTHAGHQIYINSSTAAVLTNVSASNPGTTARNTPMNILSRNFGTITLGMTGQMRQFGVLNRAASAGEIAQLMAWLRADAGV